MTNDLPGWTSRIYHRKGSCPGSRVVPHEPAANAARSLFRELVADDPAPYLLPDLRADEVSMEFMAGLFRQAWDAGALEAAEDASSSSWFDDHRAALVRAAFRRKWYAGLRVRLREAAVVVEEAS
jgi:hypothetical protein